MRLAVLFDNRGNFHMVLIIVYVTRFGKTLRMGYFVKIEFDVRFASSIIKLFVKSEIDCTSLKR